MNILALDLGTKTGWASYFSHEPIAPTHIVSSGVQKFTVPRGTNPDVRLLRFRKWLEDLCLLKRPKVIAYELPHMRGGYSTQFLQDMMSILKVFCLDHDILYMSVHSGTLKKHATGSGNASKEEMVLTAEQRYGKVQDDNQADALHILAWAREQIDDSQVTQRDRGVLKEAST